MKCRKLGTLLVLFMIVSGPLSLAAIPPNTPPKVNSPQGLKAFLLTLKSQNLAQLVYQLGSNNPAQSKSLLRLVHDEMTPEFFAENIRIWCQHPDFLKNFIDTSVKTTNLEGFSAMMKILAEKPELVRETVIHSIEQMKDPDLVVSMKAGAKHPEALKLFSMQLEDEVLAAFTIETLEDEESLQLFIQMIQESLPKSDPIHRSDLLLFDVNIYDIAEKLLKDVDKEYFKELLFPKNSDPSIVIQSLSLMDGIINPPGKETIDIAAMDKQALKMVESPWEILTFLWNFYFGDQSSQKPVEFRKALLAADALDGQEDGIVQLNPFYEKHQQNFKEMRHLAEEILSIARFRKKLKDPEILLNPSLTFIQTQDAQTVAKTLSPLYIRSLKIRPSHSKIVVRELPPEVLGKLTLHMVEFLEKTPEGLNTLRKLALRNWKSLKPESLQRSINEINATNTQALYDLVTPVMLSLSPDALSKSTLIFLNYPDTFYEYNTAALQHLTHQTVFELAEMILNQREAYFWLTWDIATKLPPVQQNTFLWNFTKNPQTPVLIQGLMESLDREFLENLEMEFSSASRYRQQMKEGLPKPLVSNIQKSAQIILLMQQLDL